MSGRLGLSSPWARDAVPEPLRSELRALIPDGWTVGVSTNPSRAWFKAWANDERGDTTRYAVHIEERRSAEVAVRRCVAWIRADVSSWRLAQDMTVTTPLENGGER